MEEGKTKPCPSGILGAHTGVWHDTRLIRFTVEPRNETTVEVTVRLFYVLIPTFSNTYGD